MSDRHKLMGDVAAEFLSAARSYRAALRADDVGPNEFARHIRNALARVYLAGALLGPPTIVEDGGDPSDIHIDWDARKALQQALAARFREHDVFVEVSDPSRLENEDVEPFDRFLSSELVEIDGDLGEAIGWLEHAHPNALWNIRWAIENHWGQHAVACLRPLHQMATYAVV